MVRATAMVLGIVVVRGLQLAATIIVADKIVKWWKDQEPEQKVIA